MINLLILRLTQIYKNKAILALSACIVILFSLLVSGIYDTISLPQVLGIGVIDLDKTEFSEEVMRNVASHSRFDQSEVDLETGIEGLKSNAFELVYIINEGAMDQVLDGDYEGLISLYYIGDNYLSPLLGDVLVGKMYESISVTAGLDLLEIALHDFEDKEALLSQALTYSQVVKDNIGEGYYLDVELVSPSGDVLDIDAIDVNILYKQMLLGIILAFIGFYCLFCTIALVRDYENHLMDKISITTTSSVSLYLGNLMSVIVASIPLVLILSLLNGFLSGDPSSVITYLIIYGMYVTAFSAMSLLIAQIVRNVSAFVVIGSSIVLVLGIVSGSFFNIDLTIDLIQSVAKMTYTYYALSKLLDLASFGFVDGLLEYCMIMLGFLGVFAILSGVITKVTHRKTRG